MERDIRLGLAIVALDCHELVAVFGRHWHRSYLHFEELSEVLRIDDALAADRACNVCPRVAGKACAMHGVAAAQKLGAQARVLHIGQADHAVLLEALVDAVVIVFQAYRQAALAIVAVEKVLAPSDAANAALLAVEDFLLGAFVIVEGAHFAEVLGEILVALYASLGFRLLCLAPQALDMRHFVSIKSVVLPRIHLVLVVYLIVAKAASVERTLANRVWALELASPQIVLAAVV